MTRVLEVIYGFGYGGIRAYIMNYLNYLDKKEFQVDIYVFGWSDSPFTKQVEDLGARIFFEPENISNSHIPRFVGKLEKFMKENGPYDVCHANCNLISAWVLLAAKKASVPIRLSHSHSSSHFEGSLLQRAYSHLRLQIINHVATAKLACGQLAGEKMYGKNSHFVVTANGINLDRFSHRDENIIEDFRRQFNIPEGVRVYANVTRMDPPKNHIFAVEVFNEIHKIDPTAIFLYGGVTPKISPTVDSVKARIEELGLEEFTRYTGPLMNIEQVYHLSDLWIYCSAYEGLPFGPIELQAAGVPCIASDVITKEIDLGLGLVKFLSLNASYSEWAKVAVDTIKTHIDQNKIEEAFNKYNFNIKQNVKMLEAIYKGKLK